MIFVAALLVAHYTRFGRYIYALGGDEQSATLMGLPVGRTKIFTYTVSGFCSALSGVVYTFYTQSGDPASCVGLELRHCRCRHWGHALERRSGLHGRHGDGRAYPRFDSDPDHVPGQSQYVVDAHRRRHARVSLHPAAKRHLFGVGTVERSEKRLMS